MFSSVLNIAKKIESLNEKEKQINSYYDPQGSEKNKRHRHFVDIYQDYNEEMKNYGKSIHYNLYKTIIKVFLGIPGKKKKLFQKNQKKIPKRK